MLSLRRLTVLLLLLRGLTILLLLGRLAVLLLLLLRRLAVLLLLRSTTRVSWRRSRGRCELSALRAALRIGAGRRLAVSAEAESDASDGNLL